MKILEISQGRLDATGLTLAAAVDGLRFYDDEFLRDHPESRKYFFRHWRVLEATDGERAPWGREWWAEEERGRLRMHSARYDSSG